MKTTDWVYLFVGGTGFALVMWFWSLLTNILKGSNTKRIIAFCNEYQEKLKSTLSSDLPKKFTVFANERFELLKPWTCGEHLELVGYSLEETLLEHAARLEKEFPAYTMKLIALVSIQPL